MEDDKKIRELTTMPGEDLDSFCGILDRFRSDGIEVIGIYNGIRFSNMGGKSSREAYREAMFALWKSDEFGKAIELRSKELCLLMIDEAKKFIAENKGKTNLTTDEILKFLAKISKMDKLGEGVAMPQEIADEIIEILHEVGYDPIPEDKAYATGDHPEEYKGMRVYEYIVYVPEDQVKEFDSSETLATYSIRNAMLQLQKGSVNWRNSEFYSHYREQKNHEEFLKWKQSTLS